MATTKEKRVMISPEATPNPTSVRFLLDQPLLEHGTVEMTHPSQADRSPLARRLFALPEVTGVFLGPNFVTVTTSGVDWDDLAPLVMDAIREHYRSDEPSLIGDPDTAAGTGATDVEQGILRVIEEEIRPAVAMDGGDVIFGGYEDGIVHLHLRGACSGCPSATMTLKMGIERRLKEEFPEIKAVQAI